VRKTTRQRVFLTFAVGDLAQARPVTARLVTGGDIALDQAFTREPFEGARGDIIRASLLTRLSHCASALCLYGARTVEDDWVRWALQAASELRLPLLGVALPGVDTRESERYLAGLGAEFLPLVRDDIISRTRSLTRQRRPLSALDATSIVETLHLMRHPLR
jgi:hypothetical protein